MYKVSVVGDILVKSSILGAFFMFQYEMKVRRGYGEGSRVKGVGLKE